jgi:hypothetical protein
MNEYESGPGITQHVHSPAPFSGTVVSLSVGLTYIIGFPQRGSTAKHVLLLNHVVPDALTRYPDRPVACDTEEEKRNNTPRSPRVSLTFRKVEGGWS